MGVKGCVVIPCYREEGRIGATVTAVSAHCSHVFVVDDGSGDRTAEEAASAGANVLRHETNRGKGEALNTGFAYAREQGFEFVITMDGDGQHAPADIPEFLEAYKNLSAPVLVGTRMQNTASMPLVRRATNRFMSWLLSRMMGQRVPDTQCGYRLYRTDVLTSMPSMSQHFAAESEILLDLAANGVRIGSVPITVIYGDEQSKIHAFRDTVRFFSMLIRWKMNREKTHSWRWHDTCVR
jgi:glycosyltransferase involved in cell wall biosynthesis